MSVNVFLSVVVPVYNEEDSLPEFLRVMRKILPSVTEKYEIIFAVDPCTDGTVSIIEKEHARDNRVKMLLFSRRFGQPAATMAGLQFSSGAVTVVIDCDMQDPPELIPEMVELWRKGYKVVIPQRRSREGENFIKRLVAYTGYWFINRIATVKIPRNTGDFRLLDRRVVEELCKLNESHGFLRGLVSVVGFSTYLLPFDRKSRIGGEGKYNRFTGSLRIGFNGIVAFSDYLLNMMVFVGFGMSGMSVLFGLAVIIAKAFNLYEFAPGLPTAIVIMLFIGGMQFIGMGVLGAYIGRIYDEAKRRPKFIVDQCLGLPSNYKSTQEPQPEVQPPVLVASAVLSSKS